MKKYLAFVAIAITLSLPSNVSAQQNVQNGGGLQNPSSGGQNTRNLQTPATPTQGSNTTLLESSPDSLGVVGNPSQQKPSVTVGPSTSKTNVTDTTIKKSSKWQTILIIAILAILFWYVYRKVSRTQITQVAEIVEEAPKDTKHPNQVKKATTEQPKKKSTGQRTKKKKKKRTHR